MLRRRIQVKRAPDRDRGQQVAFQWRISVARGNRRPEVTEGVVFTSRDGAVEAAGGRTGVAFGTVVAVLASEHRRCGAFPERLDIHEAPRPDPTSPPPVPINQRRGESGLGLGSLAERVERQRRQA